MLLGCAHRAWRRKEFHFLPSDSVYIREIKYGMTAMLYSNSSLILLYPIPFPIRYPSLYYLSVSVSDETYATYMASLPWSRALHRIYHVRLVPWSSYFITHSWPLHLTEKLKGNLKITCTHFQCKTFMKLGAHLKESAYYLSPASEASPV